MTTVTTTTPLLEAPPLEVRPPARLTVGRAWEEKVPLDVIIGRYAAMWTLERPGKEG